MQTRQDKTKPFKQKRKVISLILLFYIHSLNKKQCDGMIRQTCRTTRPRFKCHKLWQSIRAQQSYWQQDQLNLRLKWTMNALFYAKQTSLSKQKRYKNGKSGKELAKSYE